MWRRERLLRQTATQHSYLPAATIYLKYKVNYFENLLTVDLVDLGRLYCMEPHAAADNIGAHTFKDLLPNDVSSKERWEALKRSIQSFGPLGSEVGHYSLIHACTETGRDHLIRHLIRRGVNIDQKDSYGRTPVFIAVEKGHNAALKLLIEKGADINVRSVLGTMS